MTILNNDIVNSNYLFEYFLWFVDLKELASNSNPPSISAENSYEYKIPVPPLNVQQQIVDECIVIDNAVREAEKTISEAKAGIEKKISDSLQRAIQVKFDSVATLEYGKPLKEEVRIAGDIPVMGSNGIVGYHDKSLIKGPSIIVGRKGSAGAVVYIEEDSFPIDTTFYVKYDATKVNLKFFYYLLQASNLPEIARGKGIGVPGLNRNNVHNLKIPLPSITEQQKIVKEIELLETQIAQAKITIENAPAQKQAVLKKWLE
jgi:restriction endonuclease S subunit